MLFQENKIVSNPQFDEKILKNYYWSRKKYKENVEILVVNMMKRLGEPFSYSLYTKCFNSSSMCLYIVHNVPIKTTWCLKFALFHQ